MAPPIPSKRLMRSIRRCPATSKGGAGAKVPIYAAVNTWDAEKVHQEGQQKGTRIRLQCLVVQRIQIGAPNLDENVRGVLGHAHSARV